MWALKHYDYEAAELIKKHNLISDECAANEHDDCPVAEACACPHHSGVRFPLRHPELRSLTEASS